MIKMQLEGYTVTSVEVITVNAIDYRLVVGPQGYRLLYEQGVSRYTEWPIVVPSVGFRWAVYAFNGLHSSADPNRTLPYEVTAVVKRHMGGVN